MTGWLLLCLGAAVGAPARYLVDRAVQARHDSLLPWGTLTVNVAGSLVLGVLVGLGAHGGVPEGVTLAVGTGTFSYETLRLTEDGALLYAGWNVALSLTAGLAAAAAGYAIGSAL